MATFRGKWGEPAKALANRVVEWDFPTHVGVNRTTAARMEIDDSDFPTHVGGEPMPPGPDRERERDFPTHVVSLRCPELR